MPNIRVRGTRDETQRPDDAGTGKFLKTRTLEAVEVGTVSRAGVSTGDVLIEDVPADAVLELEFEDGATLWTSVAEFRAGFSPAPKTAQRGKARDELVVPERMAMGGRTRGLGKWLLKALRVLDIDPAEKIAETVIERIEAKLVEGPGVYRLPIRGTTAADENFLGERVKASALPTDRPILLFIHGTASSTEGSFSKLRESNPDFARELDEAYAGHVYAFEHRTLSLSPLENVVELLRSLPKDVRLHLVSHSRGGLVGEILCRGQLRDAAEKPRVAFLADEKALFKNTTTEDGTRIDRARDRKAIDELNRLFKAKNPQVERFVRVACPARGTLLASRRLDRYLTFLLNALGLVPGLKQSTAYEFAKSLLLLTVKKRTDPATLPGLEAQMPSAPLIKVLNRPGVESGADLSVIAGDTEGEGVLGTLKEWLTDLYYRTDHDLVVNTDAMYGGLTRAEGARFFADQGTHVSHFNYFRNPQTAGLLVAGLTRQPGEDAGFQPLAIEAPILTARSYQKRSGVPQPVAFLLPGIMGSHLEVEGDRHWMDPLEIAAGGFDRLRITNPKVAPEGLVGKTYGKFVDFLSTSHEVRPFPYDWRRSLQEEAKRLATDIEAALGRTDQPVRLVAHSMGGLLARVMIHDHPRTWQSIKERGGRLVMLGTPNGGSFSIPRALVGRDRLIKLLAAIDFKHDRGELLKIISRFRGMLELLPADNDHELYDRAAWQELLAVDDKNWSAPTQADLDRSKRTREILDSSPIEPEHMIYVAGRAEATPIGYELVPNAKSRKDRIRFIATAAGDGRVPWQTGIPAGVPTWYMEAEHGALANHVPGFAALLDLLERGMTTRLSDTAPAVLRGAPETFVLPDDEPVAFPDAQDIEEAALGYRSYIAPGVEAVHQVQVSVVHGNLRNLKVPVAVGHYEGDTLVGAEGVLDKAMDYRMSKRRHLGLYPGAKKTARVFLEPGGEPPGALVIGLGTFGALSPHILEAGIKRVLVDYVLELAERGEQTAGVRFASLLIGSGAGGFSVGDSIKAILSGVEAANTALAEQERDEPAWVEEVIFVELFEDRAVEAGEVLRRLAADTDYGARFAVKLPIREIRGRLNRVTFDEDQSWWRRLRIFEEGGALRYTLMGDRAKAPMRMLPTERKLIDNFVNSAILRPDWDRRSANTLFELLLPNELKQYTLGEHRLVLVVNEGAARYPWELLHDRQKGDRAPIVVRTGILRQLELPRGPVSVANVAASTALVIGDPVSHLMELPGAQTEAEATARVLEESRFSVTSLIRRAAADVTSALFNGDYKILHLAGHGIYEPADAGKPPRAGMVLGKDWLLTPQVFGQMRSLPELVFINCCHLGFIEGFPTGDFAANVATKLIEMGVRAVVAAGWAVDDAAANDFAEVFYDTMLGGASFGRAVEEARRVCYHKHSHVNTWGAYQCYGDPAYRLRIQGRGRRDHAEPMPVSTGQAIKVFDNIATRAKRESDDPESKAALERRLDAIGSALPRVWRQNARLFAAMARAYRELGRFEQAVGHYETALAIEKADCGLVTIEQLANLRARWAVELAQQGKNAPDGASPESLIHKSIAEIEGLEAIAGATSERASLIASANKRLALVVRTRTALIDALTAMATHYKRAHEIAVAQNNLDTYPLNNWLMAWRLLSITGVPVAALKEVAPAESLESLHDVARATAEKRDKQQPSFWNWIVPAECLLVRHLGGALARHKGEICDSYRKAWSGKASTRQKRSVLDQFVFLVDALTRLAPRRPSKSKAELLRRSDLAALKWIHDELESDLE